jgi:hypothetical protein
VDLNAAVEQKIQKLKELYADAPEVGKAALKEGLANIKLELEAITTTEKETAGRHWSASGQGLGAYRNS